jgi:signal transduction histidine kinase
MKWGKEMAQEHSSQFSFALLGMPLALGPAVHKEIERIAREALINAFHHSRAVRIEVEITYESARLTVRVRDDGLGIDEGILHEGKSGHWGLSGMRERAQRIGAQLNIWSSPGAGTEIELLVPSKVAYAPTQSGSLLRRIRRAIGRKDEEQAHGKQD